MAIVDARVKNGVLKFTSAGSTAESFECQVTSVAIVPNVDEGESIETLCGERASSAAKTSDELQFSIINDFSNANGLVAYSWKHRGETVDFEVQFDNNAADKWTGKVIMQALQVGGAVGEQVIVDAALPIVLITPPRQFGDGGLHTTPPPTKGGAKPGDVFSPETTVTASDTTNAGKLAGLGFVAAPQSAWSTGQKIMVGPYAFHWDGAQWAAGAA